MTRGYRGKVGPLLALVLALAGTAPTALAQDSAESRLRRLEAEVRGIKRQLAPNGDRTVAPQETPVDTTVVPGTPATTPLSDLLTRVDALEAQIARLTARDEEAGHRVRQLELRVAANEAALRPPTPSTEPGVVPDGAPAPSGAALTPVPGSALATVDDGSATNSNLSAMSGGESSSRLVQASVTSSSAAVAAAPERAPLVRPSTAKSVGPSSQRLAAIRGIAKPKTSDAADDEYSYGFRLWDAKFYPEAQQQLKLFIDKYPRHPRVSYARNLMGRILLDEGNPYEAAKWFVENYQSNRRGDRAPDSLILLAESMSRLKDTNRACIALNEFAQTFAAEAAGRLRSQYEATRRSVTCN